MLANESQYKGYYVIWDKTGKTRKRLNTLEPKISSGTNYLPVSPSDPSR